MPTETPKSGSTKMSSAAAIGILQIILQEAPAGIAAIRELVNKKDPTPQDFADAKAKYEKDTFEALAPNAAKLIAESDANS